MIEKNILDTNRKISRKTFLRITTWSVMIGFVALWYWMTGKHKQLAEKPKVITVNTSKLGAGIHWFENFILVKSAESLSVFSNRCTHAGCRINREIDGQLVCPCHGSRFDASTGKVLQGPAGLPLNRIPFGSDIKTSEITIKI